MNRFNEDTVEQAAIDWLHNVGYGYVHGTPANPLPNGRLTAKSCSPVG